MNVERTIKEENDWDHHVGDAVEGSVDIVGRKEVVRVLLEIKN